MFGFWFEKKGERERGFKGRDKRERVGVRRREE